MRMYFIIIFIFYFLFSFNRFSFSEANEANHCMDLEYGRAHIFGRSKVTPESLYDVNMQADNRLNTWMADKTNANDNNNFYMRIYLDKHNYIAEDKVTITLNNASKDKSFVWIGPCSLTLEQCIGEHWEKTGCPWSECPFCGHEREIPDPLFLTSLSSEEVVWDGEIACCEDGVIKEKNISGKFRFVLKYAEDVLGCRYNDDPLNCWISFSAKEWLSIYSDEFNIHK